MNELIGSTGQEKMENLREKIPEIGSFQDESKRLIKSVKKSNHQDSDLLDVHSLILLAKEQVKRLRETEEKDASGETLSEIFKLQDETKRLMKLLKVFIIQKYSLKNILKLMMVESYGKS